jgi:hypothetical protein
MFFGRGTSHGGKPGLSSGVAGKSQSASRDRGSADSVGFFQMRTGIWKKGDYVGYSDQPSGRPRSSAGRR